ncbi:hypothetical protein F3Y22_tig00000778pilonHSYRG00078 [Hibiscus syriacus]|uniref:Agglutinin domain-containing protein n=1 Tax=Hibiscus syriacus TaxID=106335 RepID=A0A6A3D036_HIBSY|nr:uncharacterized protein LOC120218534 [Hibiscus syriacus]KAE8734067.1 hypothetical protein F3Y22_tig00000778pilonHSYRG00078 [Hibiscus syriacus]
MVLPRFIVLKSPAAKAYLSFKKEDDLYSGYAEFSEPLVVSPDAKFEVESAKGGLVHIRSCATNNYLERTQDDSISGKPDEQYWITVTAEKKEEDQSKEWCTLFKPMEEDAVKKTYRFVHVQSGCYLCLRLKPSSDVSAGVLANSTEVDADGNDIFRVIDWDWLVILPKFVAFKANNDQYLRLIEFEGHPYLQFSGEDIGDVSAAMEISYTPNGTIRIKPINSKKYWRRSPNWIWVDSNDTVGNDKDTLFRPFKVDSKTIALLNLGNNMFCRRLTIEGKTNCLNAAIPSVTKETYLKVEEPVLSRKIENITYLTENSRIYDEKAEVVAKNTASNHTKESNTMDVKLQYTDIKTSTWEGHVSLRLEAKASFEFGIPIIANGNIDITASAESGFVWGETTTTTTVLEVIHKVTVPPMTKVTVNMVMTKGKCDVPFTFTQKDTLYNGEVVTTEVKGNTYKGSNYYNTDFNVKQEPVTS